MSFPSITPRQRKQSIVSRLVKKKVAACVKEIEASLKQKKEAR